MNPDYYPDLRQHVGHRDPDFWIDMRKPAPRQVVDPTRYLPTNPLPHPTVPPRKPSFGDSLYISKRGRKDSCVSCQQQSPFKGFSVASIFTFGRTRDAECANRWSEDGTEVTLPRTPAPSPAATALRKIKSWSEDLVAPLYHRDAIETIQYPDCFFEADDENTTLLHWNPMKWKLRANKGEEPATAEEDEDCGFKKWMMKVMSCGCGGRKS